MAGETKPPGIVQVHEARGIPRYNSPSRRKDDRAYARLVLIPGYFSDVTDAGIVMIEALEGDLAPQRGENLGKMISVFGHINYLPAGIDVEVRDVDVDYG